jgi:hypothetical protein
MAPLATFIGFWAAAKRRRSSSSVAHIPHPVRGLPASLPGSLFARQNSDTVTGGTISYG